ncbi:MAG: MoaD/ThiS family protein [Alphaproteobacteria bacterium]|nr:MoaD/ThiS family protein [Alphaproteobacteria bacterium]
MITVAVVMHGNLRRFVPDGAERRCLSVPEGTTIAGLVDTMKAGQEIWLVALNGAAVARSTCLQDGDEIDCFAPMEGG